MFIVTGESKARRLADVVRGPRDPERLPSQFIRPLDGSLEWFVDKAAAGVYKAKPARVFQLDDIREAMESNQANGKMVVRI